jgi:uncharacterized protein
MDYEGVKSFILEKLKNDLKTSLYYHDINHTLDVLESAGRLLTDEGIGEYEQLLVKTACLFHDSGMLKTYIGHEEASCELVSETLPEYGYSPKSIASINKMIITTKLPQSAQSQLEKIICDADLDYLGRDDFYMISHRLKHEWDIHNIRKTSLKEWYILQIDFLGNHRFFTKSAIASREQQKQQNLSEIIEMLNGVY